MTSTPEHSTRNDVVAVNVFPGMDPKILTILAEGKKALMLIGYAGGSVNGDLSPAIAEITQRNIPVFVLASKEETDHGTLRLTDVPHHEAQQAGVIYLEKARDPKHTQEVGEVIQGYIEKGLTGAELGEAVRSHFSYGPNEQKPIPEWEDPVRREQYFERMKWKAE